MIGSADYLTLAGHYAEGFNGEIEKKLDNTKQYSITTQPSHSLTMDGVDVCHSIFPDRFSLLFKFTFNSSKASVTLFEIHDQLAITVDTCDARLYLNFGGSCQYENISLSLKEDLIVGGWHKIGISFTPSHVSLWVNCQLTEWTPISKCSTQCNEDSLVGILLPNYYTACGSSDELEVFILTN